MSLFETRGARNADGYIDEIALAGAADAHAFSAQHAFGLIRGRRDALAQTAGSHIEERVSCTFAKAGANPDDHAGDSKRRYSVELAEPGDAKFQTETRAGDAKNA